MAGEDDGTGKPYPYLYAPGTTEESPKRIQKEAKDRLTGVAESIGIVAEAHLIRYVHEHALEVMGWLLTGSGTVDDIMIALGIRAGDFPLMIGDAMNPVQKKGRLLGQEEGQQLIL